ncbi:MerR family transcriptional regulator [Bacillus sp. AK128]
MSTNTSFSIGEFAEKTGISIRTLHYYDEMGLLRPEKHPTSGHRIYNHQDLITLQKIISLKFLGYSLEKITHLIHEQSFTVDLTDTLSQHLQALEKEKEQIEQSMKTIKRVIKLLEDEGEVDSTILSSLIRGMHTEHIQHEWMDRHDLSYVTEELSKRSDEEKIALDKTFIQFSKEVKQLVGTSVEDPKVQEVVRAYIETSFAFLGEELMQQLAEADVEEMDIQEIEGIVPSPFTEEEQQWLNEAMQFYMKQVEMESN